MAPACKNYLVLERILKVDAEIWEIEQKLKEVLTAEKQKALNVRITELKKQRQEIISEIEKKARQRIQ